MKKGMILKKIMSCHNPDIYIHVKGQCGGDIAADIYFLSDDMEKDRRIRGVLIPVDSLLGHFKVVHPFSPEMDLARSLFRLPARPS